jgi:translocation and assembly module TamA
VLFTASAEIARPILPKLPELWGAAFIDAGRAAMRWRDLEPAVGIGVGVRYRSPVGPVKLDLAWGEEVQRLRLHLTVGVNF